MPLDEFIEENTPSEPETVDTTVTMPATGVLVVFDCVPGKLESAYAVRCVRCCHVAVESQALAAGRTLIDRGWSTEAGGLWLCPECTKKPKG